MRIAENTQSQLIPPTQANALRSVRNQTDTSPMGSLVQDRKQRTRNNRINSKQAERRASHVSIMSQSYLAHAQAIDHIVKRERERERENNTFPTRMTDKQMHIALYG